MSNQPFGDKAFEFYTNIILPSNLPEHVTAFSPLEKTETKEIGRIFYSQFFNDTERRVFVFGINPGRFGSGVTGINFTDPVALETYCGIPNDFPKRRELSSEFIYSFIEKWGGAEKFYRQFYLTALCPVGFLYDGLNYNFYDSKELLKIVEPFIVETLKKQIAMGAHDTAILFGTGKNQAFFTKLNTKHHFFKKVYVLEHPRYIMQYKRKYIEEYLEKYRGVFSQVIDTIEL
jgi:hypothetical protein